MKMSSSFIDIWEYKPDYERWWHLKKLHPSDNIDNVIDDLLETRKKHAKLLAMLPDSSKLHYSLADFVEFITERILKATAVNRNSDNQDEVQSLKAFLGDPSNELFDQVVYSHPQSAFQVTYYNEEIRREVAFSHVVFHIYKNDVGIPKIDKLMCIDVNASGVEFVPQLASVYNGVRKDTWILDVEY